MALTEYNPNDFSSTPAPTVPSSMDVNDVNKLGMGNDIQYTKPEPPPEPNLVERVGEDIEKPFIQTQHTIGAGISWLGDNVKDDTPFGALGDRITRAGMVMQERAEQTLKDKFSNFTPNMMDNIVGAVPTVAGYLGAGVALGAGIGPAAATAVTTGVLATAGGLGIGAEEYNKFKEQGLNTPESTALAAAIGVPAGGVMALGFGVVGKMVEPWFSGMLKTTIGTLVAKGLTQAATGTVAGGAFGAVANTGDVLAGHESAVQGLANTAQNAIMTGVLAGGLGVHFAVAEHNKLVDGFQKLGMDQKTAQQNATDVLGQGAHVLMDKIEQHLKYTQDEQSRIQASPETGKEVRPNILDRGQIPNDQLDREYPPIDQPMSHEQVTADFKNNKYVKLNPLNLQIKMKIDPKTGESVIDPKATTYDLRYRYTGGRNQQLLDGNNLASDLRTKAGVEDQANFWGQNYSKEELQKIVDDPKAYLDQKRADTDKRFGINSTIGKMINRGINKDQIKLDQEEMAENLKELNKHLPDIQLAINPSEGALSARTEHSIFIKENGEVSKALGTISDVRQDYFTNRLYKPDAPNSQVRIEGKTGVKTFSFHSLQRVYEDPLEGIANGKRLATTKLSDLTAVLNQDTAMINYGRQLVDEASKLDTPLLRWFAKGATPKGWKEYDGMTKERPYTDKDGDLQIDRQVAASPKEIYQGMRPLVEPDWWRTKIPFQAGIQDIQAYVKTGWLGMSVYHDVTFATQTLSSIGGAKTLADLPHALLSGQMESAGFREMESIGVSHGLTTPQMSEVIDIRNKLEEKGENWQNFLNKPIVKQFNDLSEAHANFLFGPYQRWIKVNTFTKEFQNWQAKNPNASEDQIAEAGRGIARATNDTFGGRNWEALGYTKTQVSMLRTFFLAPDWVTSMVGFAKSTVQGGAGGNMTRGNLFKTVAAGITLGNGINMLVAGHPMWDNEKGHKMDVEIAPDVYFSPLRGAVGEMAKVYMAMQEDGLLHGGIRYTINKASPFAGTALMAASGDSPEGGKIWKGDSQLMQQINGVWAVISHNMPVPFNISQSMKYGFKEDQKTPLGFAATATGAARYSQPQGEKGPLSPEERLSRGNTRRANKSKNRGE